MTATTTTTRTTSATPGSSRTLQGMQSLVQATLGGRHVRDVDASSVMSVCRDLFPVLPPRFEATQGRVVLMQVLEGRGLSYGLSYPATPPAKPAPTPAPATAKPAMCCKCDEVHAKPGSDRCQECEDALRPGGLMGLDSPFATPAPAAPAPVTTPAPTPATWPAVIPANANPLDLVQAAFAKTGCEGHVVVLLDACRLEAEEARKRIAAANAKPAAVTPPAPAKPAAPASKPAPALYIPTLSEVQEYCNGKDATMGGLRQLVTRCGVTADTKCAAAMKAALLAWKPAAAPAAPKAVETPKPAAAPAPEAPKPAPAPVVVKAARTAKAIAESIDNGDKLVSLKTPELACLATLYNINPAAPEFSGKGGRARLVSAVATARKEAKAAAAAKGKPATEPAKGGMSEAVRGLLRELRGELAGNVDALAALALMEEAASK